MFYAYAITFFRNNPNAMMSRHAWSAFSSRFEEVISNLRRRSRKVDEIVDIMRLSKETHSAETVKAVNSLRALNIADNGTPCNTIPYGMNLHFYGRSAELEELQRTLSPENEEKCLKVMSIYGLGGVGKTQLALQYAITSSASYDAIAWIQSDTQSKLVQSLSTFASRLGLPKNKGGGDDDYQSVQKVNEWLNHSGKNFLLVFDNLEDVSILSQIWPSSTKGSIIITSRSAAVASRRAKKTMHLKSFEEDAAVRMLHELTGLQPADEKDAKAAQEICQLIGGLPLAMVHMSSFIQDRRYSYAEFLALYKKHAERIIAKDQLQVDYEYTLNTVWDISYQALSPNAKVLLNLLSLFDPDTIPERLLTATRAGIVEPGLQFLNDDFE